MGSQYAVDVLRSTVRHHLGLDRTNQMRCFRKSPVSRSLQGLIKTGIFNFKRDSILNNTWPLNPISDDLGWVTTARLFRTGPGSIVNFEQIDRGLGGANPGRSHFTYISRQTLLFQRPQPRDTP